MSTIEQNVMRNVALIYTLRSLTGTTALKAYVSILSLYGLGVLVWVAKVWENLASVGLEQAPQFLLSAVLNTEFFVQALLLVGAFAAVSFVRDVTRATSSGQVFA